LPKRRHGFLVHERVLAQRNGIVQCLRHDVHSPHLLSVHLLMFVYYVHSGTVYVRRVPPEPDLELEGKRSLEGNDAK